MASDHAQPTGTRRRVVRVLQAGCRSLALIIVVAGCLVAYTGLREISHKIARVQCLKTMNSLTNAMRMYVQDYDGVLPPHHTAQTRWSELLSPYCSPLCLYCPAERRYEAPHYLYRAIPRTGLAISTLAEPKRQVLLIDGCPDGIAWRHDGGAWAATVDGPTQWLPGPAAATGYLGLDDLGPAVGGYPRRPPRGPAHAVKSR
ncbi:MAG: hypothetical protein HZB16_23600 [Armatimonadetes bacterium]|nr:hypothetical protein [Armatimonadota bacterium]